MIKISKLAEILKGHDTSAVRTEILKASAQIFVNSLQDKSATKNFVEDFTSMKLPQPVYQEYFNRGIGVLSPVVASKKAYNINSVSQQYIIYTGLLDKEFVIGYDTTRGLNTSIFTKCRELLVELCNNGAFEDVDKFNKNMMALFGKPGTAFGNKVAASFEKHSLAMGRLDVTQVLGDEVSLDLVIPAKFRTDYGTTFKLYPYVVFPYLSESLTNFVNGLKTRTFNERGNKFTDVKAVTIMQNDKDDGDIAVNVKVRKVTFDPNDVEKAYNKGKYRDVYEMREASERVKSHLNKTKIGWDCLKLYMKGYNLEASLFDVIYTGIRFERIVNILPCSITSIDSKAYMIDFDDVNRLFRARVNNWKLTDFVKFNDMVNTDGCVNIPDRIKLINAWAYKVDNHTLYNYMVSHPDLFNGVNPKGEVVDISAGLDEMYRNRPKAAKDLKPVVLETDYMSRKRQIQDLLNNGVCRIEAFSVKSGAVRNYLATNNQAVLNAAYGENVLASYESSKRSLENIIALIKANRIGSFSNFLYKLQNAGVDGLVDYSNLNDNSTQNDWIAVVEKALESLREQDAKRDKTTNNPYIVNFRRINATSGDEFYGAVDVRNVVSVESK